MNKRGDFLIVGALSLLIVIGSVLAGTLLYSQDLEETSRYVGDISSTHYYDISCSDKISKDFKVYFDAQEKAEQLNFTYSKSCPNE